MTGQQREATHTHGGTDAPECRTCRYTVVPCSQCQRPRSTDPESEEGMSGMCLRCLHGWQPVADPSSLSDPELSEGERAAFLRSRLPRDGLVGSDEAVEGAAKAGYEHCRDVEETEWERGRWERLEPAHRERYLRAAHRAVTAAEPFIAARVRAEAQRETRDVFAELRAITAERDAALALTASRIAEAVAEERQRIRDALNAEMLAVNTRYIGTTEAALGYVDGLRKGLSIAAGSVPVATPTTFDERLTAYLDARGINLSAGCLIGQAAYVEEEARELLDAAEANDWPLARLEIGDVAHALVGTARQLGTTVEACMDEKLEADRGRGNARPTARAVPVVTPEPDPTAEALAEGPGRIADQWADLVAATSGPVATPKPSSGIEALFRRYVTARGLVFKIPHPNGRKLAEEGVEYAIEIAAGNMPAARLELADVVLAAARQAELLGVTVEQCIEEKIATDAGRDAPTTAAAEPSVGTGTPVEEATTAERRGDRPVEIASLPIEELPDWADLAEAVGATLHNVTVGCSDEYETEMRWPDGRVATYRDRLAIISADSELPPTEWQLVFERMQANHAAELRSCRAAVEEADELLRNPPFVGWSERLRTVFAAALGDGE